jgi:hypothetical protein
VINEEPKDPFCIESVAMNRELKDVLSIITFWTLKIGQANVVDELPL